MLKVESFTTQIYTLVKATVVYPLDRALDSSNDELSLISKAFERSFQNLPFPRSAEKSFLEIFFYNVF